MADCPDEGHFDGRVMGFELCPVGFIEVFRLTDVGDDDVDGAQQAVVPNTPRFTSLDSGLVPIGGAVADWYLESDVRVDWRHVQRNGCNDQCGGRMFPVSFRSSIARQLGSRYEPGVC